MKASPLPSADILRELLDYDPFSGLLRWKKRDAGPATWNSRYVGKPAGTLLNDKYIVIRIERKHFLAHRVIFKMMTGIDPSGDIDHRDLDGANNRWGNLRDCTKQQNCANTPLRSHSSTGFKGVTRHRQTGKYRARVRCSGVIYDCGLHTTPEEAHAAYVVRSKELHGEFSREA